MLLCARNYGAGACWDNEGQRGNMGLEETRGKSMVPLGEKILRNVERVQDVENEEC